ncbi:hypothetical protein QE152_g39830 [Popillia japonica]|uniref:Copia protein n=1 Tax=Popillia japonica TaxID=7064 RepID=A0AAW1HT05_POPJA
MSMDESSQIEKLVDEESYQSMDESSQIEKLVDEESYQIWKFQILVVFKAYGLADVVDGSSSLEKLTKAEEKDVWLKKDADVVDGSSSLEKLTKAEEKDVWLKKDAKAQKIIVTTIEKKLMMHIINCERAKDMFDKIKNIFEKSSHEQVCNLLQQFYSFSYEKGSDISLHISKIENLVHRLKTLNQIIDENMVMSKILSTLPEQYKYFLTAWESTPISGKTITNLTSRLVAEELRNKVRD